MRSYEVYLTSRGEGGGGVVVLQLGLKPLRYNLTNSVYSEKKMRQAWNMLIFTLVR